MKLWTARDLNGEIYLFRTKPDKYDTYFSGEDWWRIDRELYPEVTFDNSPQEVELKLIKK